MFTAGSDRTLAKWWVILLWNNIGRTVASTNPSWISQLTNEVQNFRDSHNMDLLGMSDRTTQPANIDLNTENQSLAHDFCWQRLIRHFDSAPQFDMLLIAIQEVPQASYIGNQICMSLLLRLSFKANLYFQITKVENPWKACRSRNFFDLVEARKMSQKVGSGIPTSENYLNIVFNPFHWKFDWRLLSTYPLLTFSIFDCHPELWLSYSKVSNSGEQDSCYTGQMATSVIWLKKVFKTGGFYIDILVQISSALSYLTTGDDNGLEMKISETMMYRSKRQVVFWEIAVYNWKTATEVFIGKQSWHTA